MASRSIGEKLRLDKGTHELKLGKSFDPNSKASSFHSIRYDFKPASVDTNKEATVSVEAENRVSVSVPHMEGSGKSHTVYQGNKKPVTKECVLIINHDTGEITLEKFSHAIQLKKTRQEGSSKLSLSQRPVTPIDHSNKNSPKMRAPVKPAPTISSRTPQQSSLASHKPVPTATVSPEKDFNSALQDMDMDISSSSSSSGSSSGSDSDDSNTAEDMPEIPSLDSAAGKSTPSSDTNGPTHFIHSLSRDLQLSDTSDEDDSD